MTPRTPPQSDRHPPPKKPYIDTPVKAPLAASDAFQGTDLDKKRDALILHLGDDVPICPLEYFFQSIFRASKVSLPLVAEVRTILDRKKSLVEGRWKQYKNNPRNMKELEDVVYSPIAQIHATIVAAGKPLLKKLGLDPALKLVAEPTKSPIGENKNATRPDSYSTMIQQTFLKLLMMVYRESWFSIPVTWEFKKSEEEEFDNIRKTLYNLNHILSNDPRRRFAFGITIENTRLRLWFASRSGVLVSEDVDFIAEPNVFIRLVLTLAFATPHELGFDETISQFKDQANFTQYKMVVDGRTFITIKPLSDYRATGIRGSGTRVWLVHDEEDPEKRHVLKDTWIPRGTMTEGDQLRRLHEKLAAVEHTGDREPSDYFLTVLEDGYVCVSDATGFSSDDTLDVILGGLDIPEDAGVMTITEDTEPEICRPSTALSHAGRKTHRSHHTGLPSAPKPEASATTRQHHYHRIHYRVVFKEFGKTLHEMDSLSAVMCALGDATQALKFLHYLGWVHRDVSPGNILVVGGRAKVADLECLKPYREDKEGESEDLCTGAKEHRTATSQYTAVEVALKTWYFRPPDPVISLPFFFIPLHDLESILWIGFWVVTRYKVEDIFSLGQIRIFNDCFGAKATHNQRFKFLFQQCKLLKASDFPGAFSSVVEMLQKFTRQLHIDHSTFEKDLDPATLDLTRIHEEFVDGFAKAAKLSQDVQFVKDKSTKDLNPKAAGSGNGKKRARDTARMDSDRGDDLLPVASTSAIRAVTGKAASKKSRISLKSDVPSAAEATSSATEPGPLRSLRRSRRLNKELL
ncbi:hypothetical protein B0H15DRAFT_151602 [Mycena belliarum]|uniref:Fungal-type protein kinase domain-containing protein n=1 Tax=Mycena belliarum TaxID=1033014 RepID=A0AAD6UAL3_9AGAR|nr:hypothetical protein B0H15DRAFT_151602 [Mycena belliae]